MALSMVKQRMEEWVQSYVMTGVQSFSLLAIFWVLAPLRWKWN
jgi:hypothetical protein